ncbi:Ceramidase [Hartmannibacter diazotrophicus]|uniref:Ceramidase n=1 Tax=Hartmannibacter diazotrophicus TaxID=1482074 RepID=A0A2C9D6N7_9HYPH|nr:ceramidase domain-containing protein [Hartmannibacter diazotrophicus]SON55913.1 Ceramidase [Hartmannibacter diazotrophicus]
MDLWQPVDIYCERLGPGFWAEPLNALSNLSFVLAGLLGLWLNARHARDGFVALLSAGVIVVGIGSFLFHTFANRLTGLADVIPIWSFVVLYIVFALRRFFGQSWLRVARTMAIAIVVAFGVMAIVPGDGSGTLNGSLQYLPAILGLVVFSAALSLARHAAARYILAATAIFLVSLAFRTVDIAVCEDWPLGTHVFWHLLNGTMLGVLLVAAARHGVKARA